MVPTKAATAAAAAESSSSEDSSDSEEEKKPAKAPAKVESTKIIISRKFSDCKPIFGMLWVF